MWIDQLSEHSTDTCPSPSAILNPMNPPPVLVSWFHEPRFGFRKSGLNKCKGFWNRFQFWNKQIGPMICIHLNHINITPLQHHLTFTFAGRMPFWCSKLCTWNCSQQQHNCNSYVNIWHICEARVGLGQTRWWLPLQTRVNDGSWADGVFPLCNKSIVRFNWCQFFLILGNKGSDGTMAQCLWVMTAPKKKHIKLHGI